MTVLNPATQELILNNVNKQQGCACSSFVGERAEKLFGETWAAESWHFDGLLGIFFS